MAQNIVNDLLPAAWILTGSKVCLFVGYIYKYSSESCKQIMDGNVFNIDIFIEYFSQIA